MTSDLFVVRQLRPRRLAELPSYPTLGETKDKKMRQAEQMNVAGFKFTMEPAFDWPLTMNEHLIFNEACARWRQGVLHAMQPWLEPAAIRLITNNGQVVDFPIGGKQAVLEAPSATGKMPPYDCSP